MIGYCHMQCLNPHVNNIVCFEFHTPHDFVLSKHKLGKNTLLTFWIFNPYIMPSPLPHPSDVRFYELQTPLLGHCNYNWLLSILYYFYYVTFGKCSLVFKY